MEEIFKVIVREPEAFIRDQHRDSPDLCDNEKLDIISQLYESNKMIFLQRYNRFLNPDQLHFIESIANNQDISYFVQKIIRNYGKKTFKRRRYAALQKLIQNGDYFKDFSMRERDPYLYEQMVGKYLTEQERQDVDLQDRHNSEMMRPLSSFLLRQIDKSRIELLKIAQQEAFENQIEEEDEDEDEDEDDDNEEQEQSSTEDESENFLFNGEDTESAKINRDLSEEKKAKLRKEFLNIMYERFLDGKEDFDYRAIDNDDSYDPIQLIEQDEQDSYFDSEEAD